MGYVLKRAMIQPIYTLTSSEIEVTVFNMEPFLPIAYIVHIRASELSINALKVKYKYNLSSYWFSSISNPLYLIKAFIFDAILFLVMTTKEPQQLQINNCTVHTWVLCHRVLNFYLIKYIVNYLFWILWIKITARWLTGCLQSF